MALAKDFYLIVDSANRYPSSSSSTDFIIPLQTDFIARDKIEKCFLKSLDLVNTAYNITAANNKFNIKVGIASSIIGEISPGYYTATQLISTLVESINAVSVAEVEGFYDQFTGLFTLTTAGPATMIILSTSDLNGSAIYSTLGFPANGTSGETIISETLPIINPIRKGIIEIKEFQSTLISANNQSARGNFSFNWNANGWESIELGKEDVGQCVDVRNISNLSQLSVRLLDQNGSVIDLNGGEWSFTLYFV